MQIKKKYVKEGAVLWTGVRLLVLGLALYFVVEKFSASNVDLIGVEWPEHSFLVVGLALFLMILNWLLEAIRWRISIRIFEEVSIFESIRTVLGGLALNWVLPFTTGDVVFRMAMAHDKHKTAAALVLNRGLMLSITLVYGMVSLAYYSKEQLQLNFALVMILPLGLLVLWLGRRKLKPFLKYFQQLSTADFLLTFGVSMLRYLVFVFQFYLLMRLFLPELSSQMILLGIGWIFFFKSVLPSVFGGVGVREASGLLFFADLNPALVVTPIFLIWVINSAIPTFVGAISIWTFQPARQ